MKRIRWTYAALALGTLGLLLRWSIFCFFTDDKGLLRPSPLAPCLWVVTAAAIVGAAGLEFYKDAPLRSFSRPAAAAGSFLFGVGIAVTVLISQPGPFPLLSVLARILGLAAAAAMAVLGCHKLRGTHAPFGCHGVLAVFLVMFLVARYQSMTAHTQLVDFFFPLMAGICLSLTAYWHTAFDCGLGVKKNLAFFTLLGIFFCLTAAGHDTPWLHVGGAVWMALNPARANQNP